MFKGTVVILIILGFCFNSSLLLAQRPMHIHGQIVDNRRLPVSDALVQLISNNDTLKFTTTQNGSFLFKRVTDSVFSIHIIHDLYADTVLHFKRANNQYQFEIPVIVLREISNLLKEVKIKGRKPMINLKQDTTEFDVSSYMVKKGDRLEELLKQAPGLRMGNNGEVLSMGKQIVTLRVNGKDFFSGDLRTLMKQLPAEIVSKIQIINDYGKLADLTGIKDGSSEKIINVVTKNGINSGLFGEASAYHGSFQARGVNVKGNYWKDEHQISSIVDLNSPVKRSGNSAANGVTVLYKNSLSKQIAVSGNYDYKNSQGDVITESNAKTLTDLGTLNEVTRSRNNTNNRNGRYSFDVTYTPDVNTYLTFKPSYNNGKSSAFLFVNTMQSGVNNQTIAALNQTDIDDSNASGAISFFHNFRNIGGTFSGQLDYENHSNQNTQQMNDTITYKGLSVFRPDSILKQTVINSMHERFFTLMLTFSKSLGQRSSIDLTHTYEYVRQANDLNTDRQQDIISNANSDLNSGSSSNQSLINRVRLNYRYKYAKVLTSMALQLESMTRNASYEVNQTNNYKPHPTILPSARFSYLVDNNSTLELNYQSQVTYPDNQQLFPVRDTRQIQNIIIGNPLLQNATSHNITLGYNKVSNNYSNLFSLTAGYTFINNKIVSNTVFIKDTLDRLVQETRFLNAAGTNALTVGYNWSLPVLNTNNSRINVQLEGALGYNHDRYFSEGVARNSYLSSLKQSAIITTYFRTLSLSYLTSYEHNNAKIGPDTATIMNRFQFDLSTSFILWKKLNLVTQITKNIFNGYAGAITTNPLIVNASIGRFLFKNNSGSISIGVNDLLNSGSSIQNVLTANKIIDAKNNEVTRRYVITLNFRLEKFTKRN